MRRGIIVEKNKKFVTLLTPDGQFLKAKKSEEDYEIGQEIAFPEETRMARRRAGFFDLLSLRPLKAGVFSIAAIMLIAFMIIPDALHNKAYAYMTIDINPSFELTLNKNCEVVDLVPLNQDGKDLLDSIENWENSDIKAVISEIVESSNQHGYVKHSKEVLIATVYENNDDDTYKATVKSEIADVTKKYEKQSYKMQAVESDLDTRAKAQKEGISTGRYIRKHENELDDETTDDQQEDKQDHQDENREENEKEKAVKEEDQSDDHKDTETEEGQNGDQSSNQDQTESDQDTKQEEETNTPNHQNPQENNENDKNSQQTEDGTKSDSQTENGEKMPYQKEKKPSEHIDQEYPPSGPGE